jgi:hypothetical protein
MKTLEQEDSQFHKTGTLSVAGKMAKWFSARLALFGKIIHSPENAFGCDLGGASYLVPLIILGFFSIIISLMQTSVQVDWMQYKLESQGMQPEDIAASLRLVLRTSRFVAFISPLLLFLRFLLIAAVLWVWALPAEDMFGFQKLLNIVAYSYLPLLMRNLTSCFILMLRSSEALHTTNGLSVPLGLDLLFRGTSSAWTQLAGKVNLFEAWFVLLLILGVAGVGRISMKRALWVVIPSWLSIAAIQCGLAYLGIAIQE